MIRVLHVTPSLERSSGIATFVYNMYRSIDDSIACDFLHQDWADGHLIHGEAYDGELMDQGAKVYRVTNPRSSFASFVREVGEFFESHGGRYDIVHCHVANAAFCVLREAKKAGINIRLLHSHLNTSSEHLLRRMRNRPLIAIGKRYATAYVACSEDAGKYLFGRAPYTLIRNGIPLDRFNFDEGKRVEKRQELGIPDTAFVVGCVGRIAMQKNHAFAVDVFNELRKTTSDAILVVIGDGELRQELERKIDDLDLNGKVLLLGNRSDVNELYSVLDVFLMPSLCEGLPFSAVEAQAAGLPCVYSTGVPRETDVTGTGRFLSLDEGLDSWVNAIREAYRSGRSIEAPSMLENKGYSIKASAQRLAGLYGHLLGYEPKYMRM